MTLEAHISNLTANEKRLHPTMKCKVTYATTKNGERQWHVTVDYATSRIDARKAAAEHNATPWNF